MVVGGGRGERVIFVLGFFFLVLLCVCVWFSVSSQRKSER